MNQTELGAYAPIPKYRGAVYQSFYVPMRDGVKLAVEVILPKNLPTHEKIPAILIQTRYWRLMELRAPLKWFITPDKFSIRLRQQVPFFISHGYAFVLVDVRGTGASFGVCRHPWPPESIEDARKIVDWIIAQSWSNGRVGGMGGSYVGTTAELLAATNHPAVKCTLPMFNHPDAYTDIAFPGGVFNRRFIQDWSDLDWTLDQNNVPREFGVFGKLVTGVKPVSGNEAMLADALKEHNANGKAFEIAKHAIFRDDQSNDQSVAFEDIGVRRYQTQVEQSGVAICGWGSWMDAGTADAVIRRFLTFKNAGRGVIGAWEHGCMVNSSPYRKEGEPVNPLFQIQLREMLRFFDDHLKDADNGVKAEKILYYYTLGAERWQSTDCWPPAGTRTQRWYLAGDHALALAAPTNERGEDKYTIDFEATTGDLNRWWEIGGLLQKAVTYPNRAQAAQHLLTYLSAPLAEDTEITGYPIVTLYVTSTETDGAFIVYLEDVDKQGNVFYATEGQLRAIHRKVSNESAPYNVQVPYHTFKQKDAQPLIPGEIAELKFGLNPISVLIRQGHRIRLGIAGHDLGTFARIPETGTPTIILARNRQFASSIDLPIVKRG